MQELFPILLVAIALSMDTFSFSLSLGTANIEIKKGIVLSIFVGIMHFIMPLLGNSIGKNILKMLPIEPDFFLGIIFLILAFKMIYDIYYEEEKKIILNIISMFIISLSVSFDAFTTGMGILAITNKILGACCVFMIVSFIFTISGILLGKFVNRKFGSISSIIGIIILFIMAIYLII